MDDDPSMHDYPRPTELTEWAKTIHEAAVADPGEENEPRLCPCGHGYVGHDPNHVPRRAGRGYTLIDIPDEPGLTPTVQTIGRDELVGTITDPDYWAPLADRHGYVLYGQEGDTFRILVRGEATRAYPETAAGLADAEADYIAARRRVESLRDILGRPPLAE